METFPVNSVKIWDSKIYHTFNLKDIWICLVCKESIPKTFPLDSDILLASHVNTLKHHENIKTLFNFCINSFDHDYLDIIPNLMFNILLETNETSYVSKIGNNLKCLVCQVVIGQGSADPCEVSDSIINHLHTDFHVNNVKDNCFWVYPLDNEVNFMMLHKSVVFCSSCNQNIQIINSCSIESVAHHLKVCHNNKYRNLKQQKTIHTNSDKENVSKMFSFLRLNDHDLPGTPYNLSDGGDNIVQKRPNFSESFEEILETHQSSADEFDDLVSSSDSSENGESSNESYDFFKNALVCPECEEFIEIYNENSDFSMDLHMQKHKILSTDHGEIDLDYQDNADYVCPVCQETINIFNRDLEFSVNLHFEEKRHEHERFNFSDDENTTVNKFNFVNRVFDCLPDIMQEHRGVFVMDGNEVFCKLCNCMLSSSKVVANACKMFSDHLRSTFHTDQYKVSRQLLTLTVMDFNKQDISQKYVGERASNVDSLSEINRVIKKNKQFIKKHQINYFCTICNKDICYSPKEYTQISNFLAHLKGKLHIESLNQLKQKKKEDSSSRVTTSNSKKGITNQKSAEEIKKNAIIKKAQKRANKILTILFTYSWAIRRNAKFIDTKMGSFFCTYCNETIVCTNSGKHLKEHFKNKKHN